jgi:heme oxygenase
MLVNVEPELPEAMLDQASDSKIRKAQKTKTLKNFPRVCHGPSRWTPEVTPRPAAAASITHLHYDGAKPLRQSMY